MRELLVQVCWSMSMAGSMSLAGSSLVCLSICVGQPRSLETRRGVTCARVWVGGLLLAQAGRKRELRER